MLCSIGHPDFNHLFIIIYLFICGFRKVYYVKAHFQVEMGLETTIENVTSNLHCYCLTYACLSLTISSTVIMVCHINYLKEWFKDTYQTNLSSQWQRGKLLWRYNLPAVTPSTPKAVGNHRTSRRRFSSRRRKQLRVSCRRPSPPQSTRPIERQLLWPGEEYEYDKKPRSSYFSDQ